MIESIVGGLFGGVLRLAPEVLKWLDRKDERKHELDMQDKALEFERVRGSQRRDELAAQSDVAAIGALAEAYKQQAAADSNAYKWAASVSSLVRPAVTFGLVVLYASLKVESPSWTDADHALLSTVVGFWFVSRAVAK